MPFALRDVGQECFALVFRDADVGFVFADDEDQAEPWIVALDESTFRTGVALPPPFADRSHRFASLDAVRMWLGIVARAADDSEMAA